MNFLHQKRKLLPMGHACGKGPQSRDSASQTSNTSTTTTTNTTNTDRRVANGAGTAVSGDNNVTVVNDTDVVRAIANMALGTIKDTGDSVTNIYETAAETNRDTWDATLTASSKLIDGLTKGVEQSFSVANKAIDAYTPTNNKSAESIKYIGYAVVGVAAAALIFKKT